MDEFSFSTRGKPVSTRIVESLSIMLFRLSLLVCDVYLGAEKRSMISRASSTGQAESVGAATGVQKSRHAVANEVA